MSGGRSLARSGLIEMFLNGAATIAAFAHCCETGFLRFLWTRALGGDVNAA